MSILHLMLNAGHGTSSCSKGLAQMCALSRRLIAAACVALAACAGVNAPSSELSRVEPQIHERLQEYELPSVTWDVTLTPQETISIDLENFTQSLFPFVEYVLFGTRFPDEDAMGHAFDTWINDNISFEDDGPDPYLFTLMNVILHPPEEFEEAIGSYVATGLASDGFEDRHLEDYVWLARQWLEANTQQRPDWISIRY